MRITVIGSIDAAPVVPALTAIHLTANALTASFDVLAPSFAALWATALVIGVSTRSAMRDFLLSTRHESEYTASAANRCTELVSNFDKLLFVVY